jgi:hypothetical protein
MRRALWCWGGLAPWATRVVEPPSQCRHRAYLLVTAYLSCASLPLPCMDLGMLCPLTSAFVDTNDWRYAASNPQLMFSQFDTKLSSLAPVGIVQLQHDVVQGVALTWSRPHACILLLLW